MTDHSDNKLFRDAIKGITPLKQDRIEPHREKPKPVPASRDADDRDVMDSLLSDHVIEDVDTGDELLFKRAGIQTTVMRKLRRGQYAIEAELDLHRRTVDQARDLLAAFIQRAQLDGKRCVRIVHGKGYGSANKLPVLKNMVNSWLQQRNEVLAFSSATPQDGGTGAVYVLLSRKYPGPKTS
ncbi:MAG: Smr/MutS family endonuclease [Gammaproteobacteria bacterium]|nr:Smr/MutS family endonuclease [Gammaproteobacteria bacterium]